MSPDGVLSGVATAKNLVGHDFEVVADYKYASDTQTFKFIINGEMVELKSLEGWGGVCGLTISNGLRCFGGAIQGDGTHYTQSTKFVTPIGIDSGVKTYSVGWGMACAVMHSGELKCWGYPSHDNTAYVSSPKTMAGFPTDIKVIEVGHPNSGVSSSTAHSCFIVEIGDVYCWGSNGAGQLGNGTYINSSTPTKVINLGQPAIDLAVGVEHTCVILQDRTAKCWGSNVDYRTGTDATSSTATPMPVKGPGSNPILQNIMQIDAGKLTTCAVLMDGTPYCWGSNTYLMLGSGRTTSALSKTRSPYPVNTTKKFSKITLSSAYACGLTNDSGEIHCWGNGGNDRADRSSPGRINQSSGFKDISLTDSKVWGIRHNEGGILYSTQDDDYTPYPNKFVTMEIE